MKEKKQRKEGEKMNKVYKEEGERKLKKRLATRGEGNNNKGKGQPNKNASKGQRKIEKEQRKEVWDIQPKKDKQAAKRKQPKRGKQAAKRQETSSRSKDESTRFGEEWET